MDTIPDKPAIFMRLRGIRNGLCLACLAAFLQYAIASTTSLENKDAFYDASDKWILLNELGFDPGLNDWDRESKAALNVAESGAGIIAHLERDGELAELETVEKYSDFDLSFDLMIAPQTQAELRLPGNVAISLSDSWGNANATPKIGSVFAPGETANPYAIAAMFDACKAPGLWQSVRLRFRAAPPADSKSSSKNARIEFLEINGLRIQSNLDLQVSDSHSEQASIVFRKTDGSMGIRKLSIQRLEQTQAVLIDMSFALYEGEFDNSSALSQAEPSLVGEADLLDARDSGRAEKFALVYEGTLALQESGEYTLATTESGGLIVEIDGKVIIENEKTYINGTDTATCYLEQGERSFRLTFIRNYDWAPKDLTLKLTREGREGISLHASGSGRQRREAQDPIFVNLGSRPKLHRGFFEAHGERLSHTLAVGDPSGVHYVMDLQSGSLAAVWRDPFIDASPMWIGRGENPYTLRGAAQFLHRTPLVPDDDAPLYTLVESYGIDATSGRPIYHLKAANQAFDLRIDPKQESGFLQLSLNSGNSNSSPSPVSLAKNARIERVSEAAYTVGEREYYLYLAAARKSKLRSEEDFTILEASPNNDGQLIYQIVW